MCTLTLPEWQENDRLDGEELDDGVEGSQQILGGHVEQVQRVQGNRDANNNDKVNLQLGLFIGHWPRVPLSDEMINGRFILPAYLIL